MFSLGFEKIKESKMEAQKPNAVIATSFDIILFCGPQRKQFRICFNLLEVTKRSHEVPPSQVQELKKSPG